MYSMTSLKAYEPFVDSVNATFIDKLKGFAASGQSFDLFTWMQFYAFDVIGEITIGRPFGMLEAGCDKDGLLAAVDYAIGKHGACLAHLPELAPPIVWLAKLFKLKSGFEVVNEAVEEQILLRKSGKSVSDRDDFLGKGLKLLDQGKINRSNMFNVVGSNIGAGSDTTGISATAIVYFLIKNPRCMQKLQDEIAGSMAAGELSETVTFWEGQKLQYLQAVIKEALRLHPAVGMPLARVVPKGGATLAGQFFPENVSGIISSVKSLVVD
jgi:cytochrome P450